jgi:hypothetical protein
MDLINEKVTDHNNWATHREEMLQSDGTANDLSGKNSKKKKRQKQHSRDQNDTLIVAGSQKHGKMDLEGHQSSSGLFIGSLSGQKVEGYSDDEEAGEYGAYGDDDLFEQKKKEREKQKPWLLRLVRLVKRGIRLSIGEKRKRMQTRKIVVQDKAGMTRITKETIELAVRIVAPQKLYQ